MRILHLAYEDPRQPGSGGGSVRTLEINRRLSSSHAITAVVAGYPGAEERMEHGIHWLPVGSRTGSKVDRLLYFPLALRELHRRSYDLVVEEFSAPFGPGFAPLVTRMPVVASVQWLFASQMRDKYHLPFDVVERRGVQFYSHFIAVSRWLAAGLQAQRAEASIWTIYNGVEQAAFAAAVREPAHLLFVGRLDIEQKGCDLLLSAVALVRRRLGALTPPLILIGNGPDRARLERQRRALGLDDLVDFRGAVHGEAKYELIARAHAVLMPSRFETFGMVAVESQAAGVPVIAFDVGPIREVAGQGEICLVPPFDIVKFANEICTLIQLPEKRRRLGAIGRAWARRYDWDEIAHQQENCYFEVVSQQPRGAKRATP